MWYNNIIINKNDLDFASHNLSAMNKKVLRRDKIWPAAKDKPQNLKLYSLMEFKNTKGESVRKDAKYDKQYLESKYGADSNLKNIDWSDVSVPQSRDRSVEKRRECRYYIFCKGEQTYAKQIIKDGQGKISTIIVLGTKVYELVEALTKYLPEKPQ